MSYNDLNLIKKINGVPADLRYYDRVNQNDLFFKTESDADENLEALDRNIIPISNDDYDLGSAAKIFRHLWISDIFGESINLAGGTTLLPAISIGGTTGLSSLNPDELSVIANGFTPVRISPSGQKISVANNIQLKLENTLPGAESVWAIGNDNLGFKISKIDSGTNVKFEISDNQTRISNTLMIANGNETEPSLSFSSDPLTGISRNQGDASLNFSVSGNNKLKLLSNVISVLASQFKIPYGTESLPALAFNLQETGLNSADGNTLDLIVKAKKICNFNELGSSFVLENQLIQEATLYSATNVNTLIHKRAKGLLGLPLPLEGAEDIFYHSFESFTDVGFKQVAQITVRAEENHAAGSYASSIAFETINSGATDISQKMIIGDPAKTGTHLHEGLGLTKANLATVGLDQEINVNHISKLMIDTTAGNIEIKGFIGGKEGQMLYLYRKVPTNTFTLVFNSGTATQKVLLKGSTNYVSTNDYGGITLSFDDGIWREVSRS